MRCGMTACAAGWLHALRDDSVRLALFVQSSKFKGHDTAPRERLSEPPPLLLAVDTGRVNVVTIAVMLNGNVVTVKGLKGRLRPLSFILTARELRRDCASCRPVAIWSRMHCTALCVVSWSSSRS